MTKKQFYKTYKLKTEKEVRVTAEHWPLNPLEVTEYAYSIKPPHDLETKIPPLLFFSDELFDPTKIDMIQEVFLACCFRIPGFPGYEEFRDRFFWLLVPTIG